ncbi:MAG TPA: signal peptide peptidase SppA [Thermodesulfobacteriota bacterium]
MQADRRARPGRGQRLALAAACLLLGGCITINVGPGRPGPLEEVVVSGEGRDKVAVVDLTGIILGETRVRLLGFSPLESMVDRVQAQLDRAAEDDAVKAVVLRINSPGGTVTASDIIYQAILRFKREKKVPVVASFLDLAASGGYYVAMAADEIVAHPTTITGSIGVIYQDLSLAGLYDKLGLVDQSIKSDRFKDIGSSARLLTPEERAILQSQVDAMFARFLATVRAGRPALEPERIRVLADGRTYVAEQALANGLVDRIGYMEDAIEAAKRRAGITEARVVFYVRPGDPRPTHLYAGADPAPGGGSALEALERLAGEPGGPRFLYLWTGW